MQLMSTFDAFLALEIPTYVRKWPILHGIIFLSGMNDDRSSRIFSSFSLNEFKFKAGRIELDGKKNLQKKIFLTRCVA